MTIDTLIHIAINIGITIINIAIVFAVAILQFTPSPIFAQGDTWDMINPASVVYHRDVLDIDKTLTISKVVDATMDTHPDA
ncbi:MAG: hypothetical protein NT055_06470, partial [Nitrospirae bacterium]|nr:hypothetical protein [Nitrospirota bacterium]